MIQLETPLLRYGLFGLAVLFGIRIAQTIKQGLCGPLSSIPCPFLNKFTSLPRFWALVRRRQVHYIQSLHEKYGPVVLVSPDFISFTSPEAMKSIHKVGSEFRKGPFYEKLQLSGTLVCLIDIKEHAARRKYFSKAFSMVNLLEWESVIKKHVRNAIKGMSVAGISGEAVNILPRLSQMASGVIGELVLGEEDARIVQSIQNELIVPAGEVSLSIPWYLKGISPTLISMFLKHTNRNSKKLTPEHFEKKQTMLTRVLDDGCPLSDEALVREAKAFIVAGTDTTSITATYLIWQVLKHPLVRQFLIAELESLGEDFSISNVQGLKYLHCVINETLRLNGSVSSSLPRIVPKGGKAIGGYFIPEETLISTQTFTMHRNPEIFEDPWSFKPERWENPTTAMKGAFMPFGIGSRGCIGLHLAQMELALVAAMFFREFPNAKVSQVTRDEEMIAEDMFILTPRGHRCMVIPKC